METATGMAGVEMETGCDVKYEERPKGMVDHLLKKMMHNATVMRRYIMLCVVGITMVATVSTILINDTAENSHAGEKAICAIIDYAEDTLKAVPDGVRNRRSRDSVARFERLTKDMRATGVDCPPNAD